MPVTPYITRRRSWFLVLAWACACGRSGYDPLPANDGDPGASDGGDAMPSDAGIPYDGGLPADCMVVTTEADEDDADETPTPEHQGDGLSLREAIRLANERSGADCVGFAEEMTVSFGTELPALEDPSGLTIDGQELVTLSGGAPTGLRLASSANLIRGLAITGFTTGIAIDADRNTLRSIHAYENAGVAIHAAYGTADIDIGPCLLYDNQQAGIRARNSTGLTVRQCTIANNGGSAVDAAQGSTGVTLVNDILFDNQNYGLNVDGQESVEAILTCDFFGNRLGPCLACDIGPTSITQDPLLNDPLTADYTLMDGSPAIDTGTETGLDLNAGAAGLFNGEAPDMGGLETP